MPYRDPAVSENDVVVLRAGGPPAVFQLHVGHTEPRAERFATFEGATTKGDEVARARKVRLFYIDSPNAQPYVLRDYTHS